MKIRRYTELVKCVFTKARRNLRYLAKNPDLDYIETHLVDHCNLNCSGCDHFAPLATPWFADISSYSDDMKRLSMICSNIRKIRVMGGEPLLHPQVTDFLSATRHYFPSSHIVLVTNGLLLEEMNKYFWDGCRKNNITFFITVYPPAKGKRHIISRLLKENRVSGSFRSVTTFRSSYNLKGDSNPAKAFKKCRSFFYSPFLREGKIYICRVPALAHYFNNKFGTTIPTSSYLDIYARDYTCKEIIQFLDRPSSVCSFCSTRRPEYTWARSNLVREEWDDTSYF